MRIDDWLLTAARAAIHVPTAMAVVSDLHLGYGEARRRAGDAVPLANVATALAPLRLVLRKHRVRKLAIAGDLFEASATQELADELLAWLAEHKVELTAVVPGNHDRGIACLGDKLPLFPQGFRLGAWSILHGDAELPDDFVVQGHEHPCLHVSGRMKAPCYLIGARRLILPAYSADAAGVNVLNQARFGSYRCGAIVGNAVLDFGPVALLAKSKLH